MEWDAPVTKEQRPGVARSLPKVTESVTYLYVHVCVRTYYPYIGNQYTAPRQRMHETRSGSVGDGKNRRAGEFRCAAVENVFLSPARANKVRFHGGRRGSESIP
ncbi:hypothetical protein CHU98_g6830 [Xylaria longipes]|nr:hypothetical protein CHU98_g6830 [Xylaria longipes]